MPSSDWLGPLFSPRSVAVLGASSDVSKLGQQVVARLAADFGGRLYPVNRRAERIAGIAAYRFLADLPEPVDVLVALAPGPQLVAAVEACRPGTVRFLLAIPSGFAEVPGDGGALQDRLHAAARRAGIRVVGPNSVGLFNGAARLNASIIPFMPPGGIGLSVVTQSGGFGMAVAMYATDNLVPIAKFCDIGNMVDLEMADFLHYFATDDQTSVVGIFLESVREPAGFVAALARLAAIKPVVLALVGRTPGGASASLAHLGIRPDHSALAGRLPRQVLLARTGLDLLDIAKARVMRPCGAQGRRVAIITGTGGIGAEIADLASERGLLTPEFSPGLRDRVARHLPPYAGTANPVDATPVWRDYEWIYPAVIGDIAASGEVDIVIVSVTDVAATLPELAASLASMAQGGLSIPMIVYWGARDSDLAGMAELQRAGVPCYRATRSAVMAAASLVQPT